MVNRLQKLLGAGEGEEGEEETPSKYMDYYVVDAIGDTYIVELSTALAIERHIDKPGSEVWIEFRDVFGARHRLKTLHICRITESTQETRAALRAFDKARRKEERDDEDPFETTY